MDLKVSKMPSTHSIYLHAFILAWCCCCCCWCCWCCWWSLLIFTIISFPTLLLQDDNDSIDNSKASCSAAADDDEVGDGICCGCTACGGFWFFWPQTLNEFCMFAGSISAKSTDIFAYFLVPFVLRENCVFCFWCDVIVIVICLFFCVCVFCTVFFLFILVSLILFTCTHIWTGSIRIDCCYFMFLFLLFCTVFNKNRTKNKIMFLFLRY